MELALFLGICVIFGAPVMAVDSLYGCSFNPTLCNDMEVCVEDGLFGQCQNEPHSMYNVENDLTPDQMDLLRHQLVQLLRLGMNWRSARTQCIIAYFMFTMRYDLQYDNNFCNVKHPENVWALIQVAQERMGQDGNEGTQLTPNYDYGDRRSGEESDYDNAIYDQQSTDYNPEQSYPDLALVPSAEYSEPESSISSNYDDESENLLPESQSPLEQRNLLDDVVHELIENQIQQPQDQFVENGEKRSNDDDIDLMAPDSYRLTDNEEGALNDMLVKVMNGQEPELTQLTDTQLDKFIAYVELMQRMLKFDKPGMTEGEIEEPIGDTPDSVDQSLYKKDTERLGEVDLGLSRTEHKIVKGKPNVKEAPVNHWFDRVDGNRVFIRLNKDLSNDRGKLMELKSYLEDKIARPKNLSFNSFEVDKNEISFRVDSNEPTDDNEAMLRQLMGGVNAPRSRRRLALTQGVPEKIYEKRKEVDNVIDGKVLSTGLGGGKDKPKVPYKSTEDDDVIVIPTLIVCGLVIGVLFTLLGTYVVRNQNKARHSVKRFATDLEGRPGKTYEELCRQRMAGKGDGPEPLSGVITTLKQRLGSQAESPPPGTSHHSSTSSWSEEPIQTTNMDISTGHIILSYLEQFIDNQDKLESEWQTLNSYQPDTTETTEADKAENKAKNRFADVVPYDHARVWLQSTDLLLEGPACYINASTLCDSDPRTPVYIVAQAPLVSTAAEFWQMIWEQGSVVIVNLTKLAENGDSKCHRYWPENGSEIHGIFEVHLVSEHIWCEDYLVRSFYLKNLRTNETRTVTQFHFLNWPDAGMPPHTKPLLEFRRKVNKSYRGRSCPIVVHCSDGAGRSGTYCLLDMVLNRIAKGVKEIDIAATLEHLRDQRMKLVNSKDQYEFVLNCVAEEVQAILKALPQ